jgi:hypothetical protein
MSLEEQPATGRDLVTNASQIELLAEVYGLSLYVCHGGALEVVMDCGQEEGLKAIALAMLLQSSRINSLHRTEWCTYRAGQGESYDDCLSAVGDRNFTDAWASQCLGNHIASWNSDSNEHFRAKAFVANQTLGAECPPGTCTPDEVLSKLKLAYGL